MQKTPNGSGAQRYRRNFAGLLRLGRVIILAPLLPLLILPSAPAQTPSRRPDIQNLFPSRIRIPTNSSSATPVEQQVDLVVSKQKVDVGESVSFEIPRGPKGENIEYRFYFGDGEDSGWIKEPQTTHQYNSPSSPKTYTAHADVRLRALRDHEVTVGTVKKEVEVVPLPTPTPAPTLTPTPAPTPAPTPTLTPEPTPAQVTPSPEPTHVHVTPSPRPTRFRPTATPSPTPTPVVTRPPEGSVPWFYILLVGGLIAAGALAYSLKGKPVILQSPTFHLHWDRGAPETKRPENIAINYELHLDPNFVQGKHEVDTRGANLITAIRRNND